MSYEWRRSRDLSNGCGPPTMEPDAKPCGANVRSSVSIAQTRHSLPASSGNSNSPTTRPRTITHGAAWMPGLVPNQVRGGHGVRFKVMGSTLLIRRIDGGSADGDDETQPTRSFWHFSRSTLIFETDSRR